MRHERLFMTEAPCPLSPRKRPNAQSQRGRKNQRSRNKLALCWAGRSCWSMRPAPARRAPTQGIDQPTTFRFKLFIGFYRVQLDLVKCFLFEALVMLNESELSNQILYFDQREKIGRRAGLRCTYRVEHRQTAGEKLAIYRSLQQTACNPKTHYRSNHVQDL